MRAAIYELYSRKQKGYIALNTYRKNEITLMLRAWKPNSPNFPKEVVKELIVALRKFGYNVKPNKRFIKLNYGWKDGLEIKR